MEILENTLQVNEFARRTRHLKIFSREDLLESIWLFLFKSFDFLKKVWKIHYLLIWYALYPL